MTRHAEIKRRIAFVSSNSAWGGSEELWTCTATALMQRGHAVSAAKLGIGIPDRRAASLRAAGVAMTELRRLPLLSSRRTRTLAAHFPLLDYCIRLARFRWFLASTRPELAVLSQGGNLDGLFFAEQLQRERIPYVLIAHKAAEMYWPTDEQLPRMQSAYDGAQQVYFVSEHTRALTEQQIARDIPGARIVRNPFLVPYRAQIAWPADESGLESGLRLACIGRLFPREKGQDIVLRVLARPKWRERPVSVTFHGSGPHADALRQTARYLNLASVSFAGESADVAQIWAHNHALLLPSHCEGLPLVLVEAMLCGRVPIVTAVAGNAEVVRDGETGFLADAPTDDAFDAAMERAWQARGQLAAIGAAAAEAIRALVPPDPAQAFADAIEGDLAALPPAKQTGD